MARVYFGPNDYTGFNAMMNLGLMLGSAYGQRGAGEAYQQASTVGETPVASGEEAYQAALQARQNALTEASRDTSGWSTEQVYQQYQPTLDALQAERGRAAGMQYSMGLGPQNYRMQGVPFTADQRTLAGAQGLAQYYAGRGEPERALDVMGKAYYPMMAREQLAQWQRQAAREQGQMSADEQVANWLNFQQQAQQARRTGAVEALQKELSGRLMPGPGQITGEQYNAAMRALQQNYGPFAGVQDISAAMARGYGAREGMRVYAEQTALAKDAMMADIGRIVAGEDWNGLAKFMTNHYGDGNTYRYLGKDEKTGKLNISITDANGSTTPRKFDPQEIMPMAFVALDGSKAIDWYKAQTERQRWDQWFDIQKAHMAAVLKQGEPKAELDAMQLQFLKDKAKIYEQVDAGKMTWAEANRRLTILAQKMTTAAPKIAEFKTEKVGEDVFQIRDGRPVSVWNPTLRSFIPLGMDPDKFQAEKVRVGAKSNGLVDYMAWDTGEGPAVAAYVDRKNGRAFSTYEEALESAKRTAPAAAPEQPTTQGLQPGAAIPGTPLPDTSPPPTGPAGPPRGPVGPIYGAPPPGWTAPVPEWRGETGAASQRPPTGLGTPGVAGRVPPGGPPERGAGIVPPGPGAEPAAPGPGYGLQPKRAVTVQPKADKVIRKGKGDAWPEEKMTRKEVEAYHTKLKDELGRISREVNKLGNEKAKTHDQTKWADLHKRQGELQTRKAELERELARSTDVYEAGVYKH